MNAPAFEIKSLKKSYNDRTVLDIGPLEIQPGKIHALIGPNGAGKSTLLRILNLLDKPTEGNFKIFGTDYLSVLRDKLNWQRRMSMVLQKPSLFNQSVARNVGYGLKVRGINRQDRKRQVQETLDWLGMTAYANRNALTLSGGEAQRVALARAIIFRPDVLFLDEPTASLDPASVMAIEKIIHDIKKELGTTIIVVTHNLFQARRIADQVTFLIDGRIVETGPAAEVFAGARDERTRSFLAGDMIY